jgi:hypothetical protein
MPRSDLVAQHESLRLSTPELVQQLIGFIGRKLTAYVGCVRDVTAVDRWMAGGELHGEAEQRVRFAFQVVRMLSEKEHPSIIQSWLIGANPDLNDRSPLRLMRQGNLEKIAPQVMDAARSFLANG